MSKPNTYVILTTIFGVFALIFGVMLFIMINVDHKTIPWWVPLCEMILGYVTYSNYQRYRESSNTEQQIIQQTIHLEDTNEIGTRNIIQITTSDNLLFALCSDGTVWSQSNCNPSEWKRRPGIPS